MLWSFHCDETEALSLFPLNERWLQHSAPVISCLAWRLLSGSLREGAVQKWYALSRRSTKSPVITGKTLLYLLLVALWQKPLWGVEKAPDLLTKWPTWQRYSFGESLRVWAAQAWQNKCFCHWHKLSFFSSPVCSLNRSVFDNNHWPPHLIWRSHALWSDLL